MTQPADSPKPGGQWLKNNLVTLGSMAVFSVYTAGYFRTRDAAERFAGESVRRHSASLSTQGPAVRAIDPPAGVDRDERRHLPPMRRVTEKGSAGTRGPAESPRSAPAEKSAAPQRAAPVVAAPVVAATPDAPAPAAPVAAEPAPAQQAVTTPSAESPAPAPAPKKEEAEGWKDGIFYGWGTSRHGDIQASVEIKGGKIVGAYISQCLTRYSCSWVSMLPGQVVARQSSEVDYVSGATQSSNAFYYAVVEALKQAK